MVAIDDRAREDTADATFDYVVRESLRAGDPPMAILRSVRSGQLRALPDLPSGIPTRAGAVAAAGGVPGLSVLFGSGIPGADARSHNP